MQREETADGVEAARRVLWSFGPAELDEQQLQLRVGGTVAELDYKSIEVLLVLLRHAGEVVTKEELLATVWAGRITVEGVLTNAISRLRKVLGDEAQQLIATQHRIGYRLTAPVQRRAVEAPASRLELKAGDAVPGRPAWQLLRPLGTGGEGEVWLAEYGKTREHRVFKFAIDGQRLNSLKREATLYRLVREVLGERSDFARVLEWNFDSPPFFLECEYGGENLRDWADRHGGIGTLPLNTRLRLMADIADAVAAAHSAGVLHKDLKPANLLIREDGNGQPQVCLTDFGSSRLLAGNALEALGITRLGFTATQAVEDSSGTPLYYAPELLAGQLPTAQSDVYALGVMLYQLTVGDLQRPLTAGWEADITDELLREDIGTAANGHPARRLPSAAALAERLRTLDARRAAQASALQLKQKAQAAAHALERARIRRPLLATAIASLVFGLLATSWLYLQTRQALTQAEAQKQISQAINTFLNQDLIAVANPLTAGNKDVTVMDAVDRAADKIDARLASISPATAAELHRTIGEAYGSLGNYSKAQGQFAAAERLFGPDHADDPDGATTMQIAQLLARARQGETTAALETISALIAAAPAGDSLPLTQMICTKTELLQLAQNVAELAEQAMLCIQRLEVLRARAPERFARHQDQYYQQQASYTYALSLRGENEAALVATQALLSEMQRVVGPEAPRTLAVQTTLGDVLASLDRADEAIAILKDLPEKVARQMGKTHGAYGRVITILGDAYSDRGKHAEAIALYQEAVRIFDQGFQGRHPYALVSVQGLSTVYENAGNQQASIDLSRRALTLTEINYGPDSSTEHRLMYDLADSLLKIGQWQEAAPFIARLSQPKLEQISPSGNWSGRVTLMHGRALLQQRRYAEALDKFRVALEAFQHKKDGGFVRRAELFIEQAEQRQQRPEAPIWAAET